MTFELTPAEIASGFALSGQRPSAGLFATLPPVAPDQAVGMLAETGVLKGNKLTKEAATVFGLLAAPGRKITSIVVTPLAEGTAISTFLGPAEGGPYVALAQTKTGYQFGLVESGEEVAAIVAGYLGLGGEPEPLPGDAVELPISAWAALAALADLDEPSSMPGAVRRALGRRPGKIVEVFRTIAPAGAGDPGSDGTKEAGNWLVGAGLVVRMHDNKLQPTRPGRAVLRALRQYVAAGSVTVDHLSEAGPVRAVSLSSIRTTERLFFGAWKVGERGPVIALGEPGSSAAATIIRTLIETPNVLPAQEVDVAGAGAPAPPPPPPPPPPESDEAARNPQWIPALMYGGLVLALAGAAFGLTNDDDASGLALPAGEAVTTTVVATSTTAPAPSNTTTAAPTTTAAAVPQTVPPAIVESTTTSSTTSSTTTTSTTTTTTIPVLLVDNFDAPTTVTPLFGATVVDVTINAEGQLVITSKVGGVIPVTYPDPLPAVVEITFDFFPQPVSVDGFSAVVMMAEDPSDGSLDHYVLVLITQDNRNLTFLVWDEGVFSEPQPTTIPESAGYAINQWNAIRLVLNNGQVDAYINDVFVSSFTDPVPATIGWWGPTIIGTATEGESMLVDNVLVVGR